LLLTSQRHYRSHEAIVLVDARMPLRVMLRNNVRETNALVSLAKIVAIQAEDMTRSANYITAINSRDVSNPRMFKKIACRLKIPPWVKILYKIYIKIMDYLKFYKLFNNLFFPHFLSHDINIYKFYINDNKK